MHSMKNEPRTPKEMHINDLVNDLNADNAWMRNIMRFRKMKKCDQCGTYHTEFTPCLKTDAHDSKMQAIIHSVGQNEDSLQMLRIKAWYLSRVSIASDAMIMREWRSEKGCDL